MTNWGYNDENELNQPENQNSGGGLRQFAESVQAQNAELKKMIEDMQREREQEKLADTFRNLGVPGAEAVYNGDPKKAEEWVNSMKSVFGGAQSNTSENTVQPQTPAIPQEQQQQYQQFTEAGQHGTPMGNMEAAQAAVNSATDINSLIQAFQNGMR